MEHRVRDLRVQGGGRQISPNQWRSQAVLVLATKARCSDGQRHGGPACFRQGDSRVRRPDDCGTSVLMLLCESGKSRMNLHLGF